MDVTPRSITEVQPPGAAPAGKEPRRRVRWRGVVLGLVAVGALAFVLFRGLGNATLFFYNADEAVAMRSQLGADRFRLQGSVDGEFERTDGSARFAVAYNGSTVTVVHRGEIPKLFQPGIPVVLEGRWQGDVFASDRMLIKHNEVYVEQNPDRVAAYDEAPAEDPAR
jgi:cytochrome c-type biogenesis protein CcmE